VNDDRVVIGWNEYVDLPEWGVRGLRAKVDTGARTSAIHVENIEELPRGRVRFDVVLHRKQRDRRVHVLTRVVRRARVRSSSGHYSTRIFVSTPMLLGGVERDIELSLVDREKMIFRMLLGRAALGAPFLIDAGHRVALGRPRKRKKAAPRSKSREADRDRDGAGERERKRKKKKKKKAKRESHEMEWPGARRADR